MAPSSIPMAGGSSDPYSGGAQPQVLQTGDLIASLPAPVLRLLVLFARPISYLKRALEVLSWRSGKRVESWIVVGLWWGLALGAGHTFMYLLPPLLFLPFLPLEKLYLRSSTKSPGSNTASNPSTSETLLLTLSELNAIYALLPPSPLPSMTTTYDRFRQLGPVRLFRGLIVLWITWLCLGRIVGYRTLLALLGTTVILIPSPPLAHMVDLLSKSLFVRRSLALAFLFTFGSPPESSYRFSLSISPLKWAKAKWTASRRPSLALSFRPKMASNAMVGSALDDSEGSKEKETIENPIYFRFEVHENQRWWMGLDWTSALLPQERPSWCDLHLQPVSPPPSFSLPSSVSIVVPSPTPTNPKAKTLRTATWRWMDDDWSIVRAGPGIAASPDRPIPTPISPTSADVADGSGFSVNSHQAHSRPASFSFVSSSPNNAGLDETASSTTTTTTATTAPGPAAPAAPSAGARAQSIAEQAFTKGLERLKARTANAAAAASSSMGVGTSSQGSAAAVTSPVRRSFDSSRSRRDSQSHDEYLDELAHGSSGAGSGVAAGAGVVGVHVPTETIVERDEATDADGWVYGDNKWENMGPRGGLGKFTRRRRWKRRAICVETVRPAPDSNADVDPSAQESMEDEHDQSQSGVSTPKPKGGGGGGDAKSAASPLKAAPVRAVSDINAGKSHHRQDEQSPKKGLGLGLGQREAEGGGNVGGVLIDSPSKGREDVLRMRLKKAMGSVGA